MKYFNYLIITICFVMRLLNGQDHSINFDGVNDYVRISDNSELDLTDNYTLEAWIFPETFDWLSGIISKYHTNAANGYILRLTHQSPYTGLGFDELVTNTGLLSSNQWYHIAAVNDGGDRKLYVNGIQVSLSGSPLNVSSNNNPIRIGSDYASRFFDGRIDEVRIWNIQRTENDVLECMDSTLSGAENGLVAYFTFNEGNGDTLFDQTGNEHHGILYGDPTWAEGYTSSSILGDINFDEILNIYDAVMLVAIMLNLEEGTPSQLELCDTNQDDVIDIEDIVLLFQWILNSNQISREILTSGSYRMTNNLVTFISNGDIAGFEMYFNDVKVHLDHHLPAGWSYQRSDERLVAFSIDGTPLPENYSFFISNPNSINKVKFAGWDRSSVDANISHIPRTFNMKAIPNPFNPGCNISFTIQNESELKISIFDINGRYIQMIGQGFHGVGNHKLYWEPKNMSSGTYFVKIEDENNVQIKKILFLK